MEADEKKCPYCAEIIKLEAVKCRHCGEKLTALKPAPAQGQPASKAGVILLWVIMVPAGLLVLLLALGFVLKSTETPESRAKSTARGALDLCWKSVDDPLMSISARQFARSACQKMAADFESKYGYSATIRKE